MTPRQRLLMVLQGKIPDQVPVCPDLSNMIPARLTGKPFWDIYVHEDPPLWKAYIDASNYFDIDSGFELYAFGDLFGDLPKFQSRIVKKYENGSFITQRFFTETRHWEPYIQVHTCDNPPAEWVKPSNVGLPSVPTQWQPIDNIKPWPKGMELWKLIKKEMGERGVVGMPSGMQTCLLNTEEDIYNFYDHPQPYYNAAQKMLERVRRRIEIIKNLDEKPDFLFCGASGTLVMQTPEIFQELILPVLKEATKLAKQINIPTHVHSCGPEKELVKMAVEQTDLTVIDPLEIPPMGDCNLAQLKKEYGDRILLKGNLHTTDVMLRGSVDDVIAACKKAMDDAAENGGFILSTGDQCGRDTPDENIRAMVQTAAEYGRYT